MATGATTTDSRVDRPRRMHPAQAFCMLAGPILVLVGILGFISDSSFDTGNGVQGDDFIIFEVNGWHNVVHIATGLFLLLGARNWRTARTVALVFGIVYGIVTLIGLIDGEDVLGLFPVDAADNVLHIALTALALIAALTPAPAGASRDPLARGGALPEDAQRERRFGRGAGVREGERDPRL